MSEKTKIIIGAAVAVVLVLVVGFSVDRKGKTREAGGPSAPTNTSPTTNTVADNPSAETAPVANAEPATLTDADRKEAAAKQLSITFTERYGSYSSESRFANFRDLYPLVTTRFRAELEREVAAAVAPDSFQGVTTRALRATVTGSSSARARVEVSVQRVTTDGSGAVKTAYTTLTVEMVFEDGGWKVDNAAWAR